MHHLKHQEYAQRAQRVVVRVFEQKLNLLRCLQKPRNHAGGNSSPLHRSKSCRKNKMKIIVCNEKV